MEELDIILELEERVGTGGSGRVYRTDINFPVPNIGWVCGCHRLKVVLGFDRRFAHAEDFGSRHVRGNVVHAIGTGVGRSHHTDLDVRLLVERSRVGRRCSSQGRDYCNPKCLGKCAGIVGLDETTTNFRPMNPIMSVEGTPLIPGVGLMSGVCEVGVVSGVTSEDLTGCAACGGRHEDGGGIAELDKHAVGETRRASKNCRRSS